MTFFEKWKNSFESSGRLPTAYLFSGPEGSGRREAALGIVRTLLGRTENHPDFLQCLPDRKTPKSGQRSLRIEAIRNIIQRVSFKPFEGDRVIVLIEDMELMTIEAANALLKTLEEPPDHVLFLLITAAVDKLPATIRSRCQKIVFAPEVSSFQVRLSDSFATWQETLTKLASPTERPFVRASDLAESVSENTEKLPSFFELLKTLWRDGLAYQKTAGSGNLLLPQSLGFLEQYLPSRDAGRLLKELDWIEEAEHAIEGNVNKTLALERLFMKLVSPS